MKEGVLSSVINTRSESSADDNTLRASIETRLPLDRSPNLRKLISVLDLLDGTSIADKKTLFVYYLWMENPNIPARVATALGLTDETIERSISTVYDSERLQNALDTVEAVLLSLKPEEIAAPVQGFDTQQKALELQEQLKQLRRKGPSPTRSSKIVQFDQKVLELKRQGLNRRQISEELQATRIKVRNSYKRLAEDGLIRETITDEATQDSSVKELVLTGLNNYQIANELDISRKKVEESRARLVEAGEIARGQRRNKRLLRRLLRQQVPDRLVKPTRAEQIKALRRQGLGNTEIAERLAMSRLNVNNVASELIRLGEIEPISPKGRQQPKTKRLSAFIEGLFTAAQEQKIRLSNKEILKAIEERFGVRMSNIAIQRHISKLMQEGRLVARRGQEQARVFDAQVKQLHSEGLTYQQIAVRLGNENRSRVAGAIGRLMRGGQANYRATEGVRNELVRRLQEHLDSKPGEPVNLSKLARDLGVTRERVRQLYNKLLGKETALPAKKSRNK